jgi:predicted RNA-binding protein YlxR (DUF448 family)
MIKKIPIRTCVVSKEKLEKKDLFRIVKTPDNEVLIDDGKGKINGRGAYLKKDEKVILKAKNNKILERRLEIKISEDIFNELLEKIK